MAKVSGSGNMYQTTGQNWPSNTKIVAVLRVEGAAEEIIGSATTNTEGQFSLQVSIPRIPDGGKSEVEIRSVDQPYSAWFSL
jgi:predicted secreted Zn-dependent protease